MRERITIQRALTVTDEMGGESKTWTEAATIWAARRELSWREATRQAGRVDAAEAKFEVRHRDVTLADRVTYQGQTYELTAIEQIGHREGLRLFVRAA